jgi:predicted  nucleic acid-binding Zn-ribbon protein
LLDLQELDTTLDQLDRRRKSLPEIIALAELTTRRADLETRQAQTRTEVDDIRLEQRKADNDVERVKDRRTRDRERIDRGLVGSPKELEALQSEIISLDHRINDLEDVEIAVMERLEETETALADLGTELDRTGEDIARHEASLAVSAAELDELRETAARDRAQVVAAIPSDLLTLYERLRVQFGGVAVGVLYQGRCESCRLELTAADLSALRNAAEDEVLRCEECQRILVRTPTSGL